MDWLMMILNGCIGLVSMLFFSKRIKEDWRKLKHKSKSQKRKANKKARAKLKYG